MTYSANLKVKKPIARQSQPGIIAWKFFNSK